MIDFEFMLKSAFYAQCVKVREARPVTNGSLVRTSKTHALGDGLWSIEALDDYGCCLKEFVGSNGQCYDEKADDLWSEYRTWANKIAYYAPSVFRTPDGNEISFKEFCRGVENGILFGVILSF